MQNPLINNSTTDRIINEHSDILFTERETRLNPDSIPFESTQLAKHSRIPRVSTISPRATASQPTDETHRLVNRIDVSRSILRRDRFDVCLFIHIRLVDC